MYRIISQRSTLIVAAPDTSYFVLLVQKQGNAAKRQRCYRFRTGRCPAFPIKKICLMADFLDILYGFAVIF